MSGTNYPGALDDSTSLPDPSSSSYTNSPSHAGLHDAENAAIKALEAKVGTGASTPPGGGYIFTSSSNGTSSWQPAPAAGVWGLITGTLSSQTDLQTALNAKLSLGGDITGGTASAPQVTATHLSSALPVLQGGTGTTTSTGSGSVVLSAGPALTGNPTAPTQSQGDNSTKIATTAYVDALGSTTLVRNETPGGSVNGSNVNFTTAATFGTGSLKVYLNGQRLAPGSGIDYVEVTQGFTMQYAPATGDVLLVDYETTNTTRFIQGSNSIIVNETPSGTVNGSTTVFTVLQGKYVANTLEVYLNGLQQIKTTDFTETSPGSGTFTMTTAPATGQVLRVAYQFATGASGNADTVDGFHASSTPTANTILPLNGNAGFPVGAIDWSTFANNIKSAFNTSTGTLTNSSQDLASVGLSLSFTVVGTAYALVTVSLGIFSSSDFEFRPEIRLGGAVQATFAPSAAAGNASSRSTVRSFSAKIPLSNGVNVLSAGVFLAAATSPGWGNGAGYISAIVFGNVTA